MSSTTASDTTSSEKFTGRVKWFNNKAGYGFVTVTDGSKSGSDVFIHHSAIKVDSEQYKYLVQGEYVEFGLSHVEGGKHEYQASTVCGIKGGKLMCETRNEFKSVRSNYKSVKQEDESPVAPPLTRQDSVRMPRSVRTPEQTTKQYKPRPTSSAAAPKQSDGEWTHVKKRLPRDADSKK